MESIFKGKYRIPSTRLTNWDYGSHGLYFITICTKDKVNYFGEIAGHLHETQNVASLLTTEIGEVAYSNWLEIPKHFQFVEIDEFVIMPNHIHGILFINKPNKESWQTNKFGVQSKNLASIIRGYKASVKTYATTNAIEFLWQSRYHDRVIRDDKEYRNVKNYIANNPQRWLVNQGREDDLFM